MVANCHSSYAYMWTGLVTVYIILLSIAVVIVAIISKNIRLAHFKDTKKVNLNIFLTLTIGIPAIYYYLIFVILRLNFASFVVVYIDFNFLVLLSQFTLFVPKIWPIFLQTKIIKTS